MLLSFISSHVYQYWLAPLYVCRSGCRAVLCEGWCGESLCSLLHTASAQRDQQPALHLALQEQGLARSSEPQPPDMSSNYLGAKKIAFLCCLLHLVGMCIFIMRFVLLKPNNGWMYGSTILVERFTSTVYGTDTGVYFPLSFGRFSLLWFPCASLYYCSKGC